MPVDRSDDRHTMAPIKYSPCMARRLNSVDKMVWTELLIGHLKGEKMIYVGGYRRATARCF